jgi:hypothetical protein
VNSWSATCRSVINYELNIHPLWSWPRQVIDPLDGVTVLADHTCTQSGCHAPLDAMGQVAVPQAQLNLTDGLSPQQMDQFNAYRELLFDDDAEVVSGGAIVDQQIQTGVDAMGNPIISTVTVSASMSAAGANASNAFFSRFDAGGTHAGYLSPDELRLIAEWLDIGAQYYNNPFDAPVN